MVFMPPRPIPFPCLSCPGSLGSVWAGAWNGLFVSKFILANLGGVRLSYNIVDESKPTEICTSAVAIPVNRKIS